MSRGISAFVPGRLVQVLAARRLSQVSLAAMVNVSPPTISKWRSGQQVPAPEALARLASVVNVSAEWFIRPLPAQGTQPLLRSNASLLVTARQMLEARLAWVQEFALILSEYVDFPEVDLPVRKFSNPEEIDDREIEQAAIDCRTLWRLGKGAVPDLMLAVESAGVVVVREETGVAQIEGLSSWSTVLDRPFALLSADKDNGFRSRFDLAHELGHLVLHKHIPRATERDRYKQMEKQAHRFAGAFLLPAETFAREVRTPVTLDGLLLLKQRWGVSVAAMIKRLESLGLVSEEEKISLYKRRSARWGVKSEPGDDTRVPETPRLLKRTVELLVTSNVFSPEAIPRLLGLAPQDIENFAALPEGFFGRRAEPIHLARLRAEISRREEGELPQSGAVVIPFLRR